MRFVEASILTSRDESKVNDLLNSGKFEEAYNIFIKVLKKNYKDQFKHINSAKPGFNYLGLLLNSIDEWGTDPDTNPLLAFAINPSNKQDIASENVNLLYKVFKNSTITPAESWLYLPETYNGESLFKLKTLIYLSSEQHSHPEYEKLIQDVLKLNKDADIQRLLRGATQRRDSEYYNKLAQRLAERDGNISDTDREELRRALATGQIRVVSR